MLNANNLYDIIEIFNRVCHKKIMVIGDILLDEYVYGKVKHSSTGIKIPIIEKEQTEYRLGGAGNVAANIAGLCNNTVLVGRCAKDDAGINVKKICNASGIKLISYPAEKTIIKQRIYIDSQQVSRIDTNTYSDSIASFLPELLDNEKPDVIVLSDYLYGVINQDVIDDTAKYCEKNNVKLFITSRRINQYQLDAISIVVLNEQEWKESNNILESKELFVTLGNQGIQYINASKNFVCKAQEKNAINVSGAGDTVLAIFAILYKELDDIKTLLQIANSAGGLAVTHKLTYVLSRIDLILALYNLCIEENIKNKILKKELACNIINTWKANGETIVFTDGCFDGIHLGHLELLKVSRHYGSKLIVGVRSDTFCKKDENNRPIQSLEQRLSTLAYIDMVDMLISFDEDTLSELTCQIKPDIYTKGAESKNIDFLDCRLASKIKYIPMRKGIVTSKH